MFFSDEVTGPGSFSAAAIQGLVFLFQGGNGNLDTSKEHDRWEMVDLKVMCNSFLVGNRERICIFRENELKELLSTPQETLVNLGVVPIPVSTGLFKKPCQKNVALEAGQSLGNSPSFRASLVLPSGKVNLKNYLAHVHNGLVDGMGSVEAGSRTAPTWSDGSTGPSPKDSRFITAQLQVGLNSGHGLLRAATSHSNTRISGAAVVEPALYGTGFGIDSRQPSARNETMPGQLLRGRSSNSAQDAGIRGYTPPSSAFGSAAENASRYSGQRAGASTRYSGHMFFGHELNKAGQPGGSTKQILFGPGYGPTPSGFGGDAIISMRSWGTTVCASTRNSEQLPSFARSAGRGGMSMEAHHSQAFHTPGRSLEPMLRGPVQSPANALAARSLSNGMYRVGSSGAGPSCPTPPQQLTSTGPLRPYGADAMPRPSATFNDGFYTHCFPQAHAEDIRFLDENDQELFSEPLKEGIDFKYQIAVH